MSMKHFTKFFESDGSLSLPLKYVWFDFVWHLLCLGVHVQPKHMVVYLCVCVCFCLRHSWNCSAIEFQAATNGSML